MPALRPSLICVASVLAFTRPAASHAAPWITVEWSFYTWNGGSRDYKFTIEAATEDFLAAHPLVQSPRLRITAPNGASLIVSTEGGLIQATEGTWNLALLKDSLLRSRYAYLTPRLRGPNHTPALIVFGWAFGSNPGSIRIIELDSSGLPHIKFARDTFDLEDIVHEDEVVELVGRITTGERFGKCSESYDPFFVYQVDRNGLQFATYSEALSRRYNLQHYIGWAGPLPNDRVVVIRPEHGRPRIVSAEDADDLCN